MMKEFDVTYNNMVDVKWTSKTYRDQLPNVFKGTVCDATILDSVADKSHSLSECAAKHSTMGCGTRNKKKKTRDSL